MNNVIPLHQDSFERRPVPIGETFAEAAKAACDWVFASFAAGCDLSLALGAWPPAAPTLPRLRAYRAIVVSTTSVCQRIVAFVDSPTLFDQPLDHVAETVLGHVASSRSGEGPAPLRLKSARRSEDLVMVHGAFLADAEEFEFVAFARRN
ncbi:MAG TPA: hypothetical protein VHY34_06840 [Caulobacteraceae bacterium]|jgi:hypothetical protein|nr:hypothetical protein [Caulobacteraceae bacterium]